MKYSVLVAIVYLLFVTACKKGNLTTLGYDNGCISRIDKNYIGGTDSVAAVNLLKANNISPKDLRYYRVVLNDTVTNVNNGVTSTYQHIFALQYFNGLPLFSSDLGFHFNGGAIIYSDGTRYNSINLNTIPALKLSQLRKLYLDEAVKEGFNSNLRDSCLSAEFGYYDLNFQAAGKKPNFVKVWAVTPKDVEYPRALFVDNSGKLIYFNSGIETLNYY